MSRRSLIWGLAGDVLGPEGATESAALASTLVSKNQELASQTEQIGLPLQGASEDKTLIRQELDTNLNKLISQFRAAVANFNRAGEKEAELTARIDKGREYCAANPADKGAQKLLLELQLELAKVRRTLDWEALQQHDIEKSILKEAGLPRGYVCGVCASIVATGTCECWKGAGNA